MSAIITQGPSTGDKVAVTFDEHLGPNTKKILSTYASRGMHGTFFIVGDEAQANPALVNAIKAGGHELGDHSWSHVRLTETNDSGWYQYYLCKQKLQSIAGVTPAYARPPYGKVNPGVVAAADKLSMRTVKWSVAVNVYWTYPPQIAKSVLDRVVPGSIVIMHQTDSNAAALPLILDGLEARDLQAVTVASLLS